MLKNYILVALRNLWRHRGYTLINVFGLTIGLASTILILLYVINEMTYDRFHAKSDQVYRVWISGSMPATEMKTLDHQVIQTCKEWLKDDKQTWLCTILRTHGSSPRPVGSLLAFNADGFQAGSLSGGCVEDDLMERVRNGERMEFPMR